MIRKRRSLSAGSASRGKRSLSSRKVPPRRRVPVAAIEVSEEVLTPTGSSKQDLILSHAEARRGAFEHTHGKFWIGGTIILCVLMIFFGWWITFRPSLQVSVGQGSDGLFQVVRQNTQQLKADLQDPAQDVRIRLEALEAERAAHDAALKRLGDALRQAQSTSTR